VQIEGKRGNISRSGNKTRQNKDRERKDERGIGLTNFLRGQEHTEILKAS